MSEEIKKLTDYAHSRKRTEMYLGSRSLNTQQVLLYDEENKPYLDEVTWVPALFTAFREAFDNSLDEIVGHKHGNRIDVTFDEKEFLIEISDNGRGIPIDFDETEQMHKATLVLSNARAGRNFGERGEVAGTNGIGISAVNFCSEFFDVIIYRDGQKFTQSFTEGDGIVVDDLVVKKPNITKIKSDRSGTTIKFKLSKKVFKDLVLPDIFLKSRIYEVAMVNPSTRFYYNGERIKVKQAIEKNFDHKNIISIDVEEGTFKSKFMLMPSFHESGEFVHSIVNNIPAFNGGHHIDTFKRFFYGGLLTALERESKRRKLNPNRSDINDGLLIFNITVMQAPNFDSQSKTRLINEEAGAAVKNALTEDVFKDIIRKNKDWINAIYERCALRTQKKEANDLARASKKLSRKKIPKLMDATGRDRTKCILILTEGDSALATSASVRNPEIHGGLPLRGKIINVNGEAPKKIIESQALGDIMTSLGLIYGTPAERDSLRYGKVFIATDADPDGANIGALLINFLYTFWPELFKDEDNPFVYMFNTPFIIAEKGKQRKYWYAYNYDDFKPSEWKGWTITRAKGLGSLQEEDWAKSLDDPDVFPIVDDGKLEETLDLIFNPGRADDRKEWISLHKE